MDSPTSLGMALGLGNRPYLFGSFSDCDLGKLGLLALFDVSKLTSSECASFDNPHEEDKDIWLRIQIFTQGGIDDL